MEIRQKGGNTYYVIGAGGSQKEITVMAIVNTIAERDALDKTATFQCMVKKASGVGGDPTVHRGWAMYASVEGGWTKIAEEESVDGVWGVKAEILKTVMTKIDAGKMEERLRALINSQAFIPYGEKITEIGDTWTEEDLVMTLNKVIKALNFINKKSTNA